ncbi:MAG: prealbumin-like fold domain-containing protein [Nitriliruptoraceae bacterium]
MGWPTSTAARSPAAARVRPAHGAPRPDAATWFVLIVVVAAVTAATTVLPASADAAGELPTDDLRGGVADIDRPEKPDTNELRQRVEERLEPHADVREDEVAVAPEADAEPDGSTDTDPTEPGLEPAPADTPASPPNELREELEDEREAIQGEAEQRRNDPDAGGDGTGDERLDSIDDRVRDRTDRIGAGKIIVCKIVAGTRGNGAGLCEGRPGSLLAGAVFELRDASGSRLDTCTSRLDGACIFPGLAFGTYQVVEVVAPQGFQLDPTPRTVTPSQAELRPMVFVENNPLPEPSEPDEPTPPEEPTPPDEPSPGPDPDEPGPGPDEPAPEPGPEEPVEVLPLEPLEPTEPGEEPDDSDAAPDVEPDVAEAADVEPRPGETAVLGLARTGAPTTLLLAASLLTIAVGLTGIRSSRPKAG